MTAGVGVCGWCEGIGVVFPGESFGGTCGWCDGKGTDWKPNYEGRGGGCEHRTCGPVRAWCFDCKEWCYNPDFGEACTGCER